MTDEVLFFILLGFLYLLECHFLLHRHSVAFRSSAGGRCGISLPGSHAGSRDRAIHLYPLFPPLRPVFFSHILPVSLSPRGILAYVSQTLAETGRPRQSGRALAFEEIRSVRTGEADLIVNDCVFVSCRDGEQASLIAETVDLLRKNPEEKRQGILDDLLVSMLDAEKVKETVAEYRIRSDDLRIVGNAAFLLIFVFFPAMTIGKGFGFALLAALVPFLVIAPLLCYFFLPLHRRYMSGGKVARILHIVRLILWPLSAIRAADPTAHSLLSRFHPVAVALALCPRSAAVEFIRKILRDLRHPISPDLDGGLARSIERDWRDQLIRVVGEKASNAGMGEMEGERSPSVSDPSMVSYCPRCHARFTSPLADCPDCPGVSPVPAVGPEGK